MLYLRKIHLSGENCVTQPKWAVWGQDWRLFWNTNISFDLCPNSSYDTGSHSTISFTYEYGRKLGRSDHHDTVDQLRVKMVYLLVKSYELWCTCSRICAKWVFSRLGLQWSRWHYVARSASNETIDIGVCAQCINISATYESSLWHRGIQRPVLEWGIILSRSSPTKNAAHRSYSLPWRSSPHRV